MKFKTHSQLMSYLLLAEKQQQLLLKNAESKPVKEAHTVEMTARQPRGPGKLQPQQQKYHGRPSSSHPKAKFSNHGKFNSSNSKPYHQPRTQPDIHNCYKCGRKGHVARDCRADEYLVKMYKELQEFKGKQREVHTLDAPSLERTDLKNYMVCIQPIESTPPEASAASTSISTSKVHHDVALLDSATTHTILRDPKYFVFSGQESEAWQTCEMITVAGRRNFVFHEGRATVVLSRGTTLMFPKAMYAPTAQRSLISFRDLRGHGIHLLTALRNGEETLALRQGPWHLATAYAGASGLYQLDISNSASGAADDPSLQ
jgi:hypothetical protein